MQSSFHRLQALKGLTTNGGLELAKQRLGSEMVNVAFLAVPSVIDANAFAGVTLNIG